MAEKIISDAKNIVFIPIDSYSGNIRIDRVKYDSKIFYTLDGSVPSINSNEFQDVILINTAGDHVISFIEVKDGFDNSDVFSKTITLDFFCNDVGLGKNIKLVNQSFIISDKKISFIKKYNTGELINFLDFNKSLEFQNIFFYKLEEKINSGFIKVYENEDDLFPAYVLDLSESETLNIDTNSYSKEKLDFLPELFKVVSFMILENKKNCAYLKEERFGKILRKLPYYLVLKKTENTVDIIDFRKYSAKLLSVLQYRSDVNFKEKVIKKFYALGNFEEASINLSDKVSVSGKTEAERYIKILTDFIEEEMTSMDALDENILMEV